MRLVLTLATLALIAAHSFVVAPALAQRPISGPAKPRTSETLEPNALDNLFVDLRRARNEGEAQAIERRIWNQWMRTPDAASARQMNLMFKVVREGDLESALAEIEQVVADHPEYPEGWNRRAWVRFLRGEYDLSLADCRKTLELEPRHFGCLSGMAMIYIRQKKPALAREAIKRGVRVNPFMRERHLLKSLPGTDL